MSKKQAFNPYLPSWEYIPDGEPHVFGDRVYVFGSHDLYNSHVFCLGNYVCWSAPVDDLSDWRCEGTIYEKTMDPLNKEGKMCLYAPDVTIGPDGRYYMYYCLDKVPVVSVAVCDTPAGKYQFYGYVVDKEGQRLGEREGDIPQFDPAVITEGDRTYLYTGFCGAGDKSRWGAMATVIGPDMITIEEGPDFIIPGSEYSKGTVFEKHAYFEGPSIRKIGDTYYLVYSSEVMHELCYATSKEPTRGFVYRGVIVSNCDVGIDTYKPAERPMAYGANNHGGMVNINGQYYIFYHRQTNGSWYSRQGCAEKITVQQDGSIHQIELTSCGLNEGPLKGEGYYPAYLACNLFAKEPEKYVGDFNAPKIMQDGMDGMEEIGYITNVADEVTAGFKYFDCTDVREISIYTRGYIQGKMQVKAKWDGEVLAEIPVDFTNVWEKYTAKISFPEKVTAIYFTYIGGGCGDFKGFDLKGEKA